MLNYYQVFFVDQYRFFPSKSNQFHTRNFKLLQVPEHSLLSHQCSLSFNSQNYWTDLQKINKSVPIHWLTSLKGDGISSSLQVLCRLQISATPSNLNEFLKNHSGKSTLIYLNWRKSFNFCALKFLLESINS